MGTTHQLRQEALRRAVNPLGPLSNYPAIIAGFTAKGIPPEQIRPRENVFTFNAWKALGRHVRKGEHGVKVVTVIETGEPDRSPTDPQPQDNPRQTKRHTRPWTTTVFHVSQTEPNEPAEPAPQPQPATDAGSLFPQEA